MTSLLTVLLVVLMLVLAAAGCARVHTTLHTPATQTTRDAVVPAQR